MIMMKRKKFGGALVRRGEAEGSLYSRCEYGTVAEQADESAYDLRPDADDDVEKTRIKFPRHKLYGRDRELNFLRGVYRRAATGTTTGCGGRGGGGGGGGGIIAGGGETATTTATTTTTTTTRASQVVFVGGYSGTGKSALIREFIKQVSSSPAATAGGGNGGDNARNNENGGNNGNSKSNKKEPVTVALSACGKFDELDSGSTPFSAVFRAVSELVERVMVASSSSLRQRQRHEEEEGERVLHLEHIRDKLERANLRPGSEEGEILVNMIPQVAQLFESCGPPDDSANSSVTKSSEGSCSGAAGNGGKPSTVDDATSSGGTTNLTNFSKIFTRFWSCLCCRRDRPVILFLDDLQWADAGSLELVAALCKDRTIRNMVFVGAYRTNQVLLEDGNHPLSKVLKDIERAEECSTRSTTSSGNDTTAANTTNGRVHFMEVCNLSPKYVTEFIAHSIGRLDDDENDDSERDDCDSDDTDDGNNDEHAVDDETATIADVIYSKTLGNIFYVMQALEELVRRNALYFDVVTFRWEWVGDARCCRAVDLEKFLSVDVVTMVRSKIARLPAALQKALTVAAHVRHTVDLETLRLCLRRSEGLCLDHRALEKLLNRAVLEGILLSSSNNDNDGATISATTPADHNWSGNGTNVNPGSSRSVINNARTGVLNCKDASCCCRRHYSFAHDRIQEAACGLVFDDERDAFLVRLSRVLVERGCQCAAHDWMLFVAVRHLNSVRRASSHIKNVRALARLNLQVARLSVKRAFLPQAAELLRAGARCLGGDGDGDDACWRTHYKLCLEIYTLLGELEKSLGNCDRALDAVDAVLEHAATLEDKHAAYCTMLEAICERSNSDYELTARKGLQILALYGVHVPEKPTKVDLLKERTKFRLAFRSRPLAAIADLPVSRDDAVEKLMYLTTFYANYTTNENLITMLSLRAMRRAVEGGCITKYLGFMVASQGMPLRQHGKYEEGYSYAVAAVTLMNRFPEMNEGRFLEARAALVCSMLLLRQPFDDALQDLFALHRALAAASARDAGLGSALNACLCFFASGLPVNSLIESNLLLFEGCAAEKTGGARGYVVAFRMLRQFLYNLRGKTAAMRDPSSPARLDGDAFDENAVLAELEGNNKSMTIRDVSSLGLQLAYIFDDEAAMEELLDTLDSYPFQDYLIVRQHLRLAYIGLASLTLACRATEKTKKKKHLKRGTDVLDFFRRLSNFGSPNAERVYLCLKAVHKPKLETFEDAIYACNEANLLNLAAMMNERCAEFVQLPQNDAGGCSGSQEEVAENYLSKALWLYSDWGATGKVARLREEHQFLRNAQRVLPMTQKRLSKLQRKANAHCLAMVEESDSSDGGILSVTTAGDAENAEVVAAL